MKKKLLFLMSMVVLLPLSLFSQKVAPLAYYIDENKLAQESNNISDGQAPLDVTFRANPTEMENYTPSYEWHFRRMDSAGGYEELFVRYEEDTQYTFNESGTFKVVLKTMLDNTGTQLDSVSITVSIAASKLEFPNAFSPNGDGLNDTFKAKDGWKSIVSFKAMIVNRWGQKIYEWNDPAGEWDGKWNGRDVNDGVYFLLVNAKGADGRDYHIRRDVNLLRGYTDGGNNSGGK